MSRSSIAVIGLLAAFVLLCMGIGGVIGGIIASDHCKECVHVTDTVYVTDTLTLHEVRVDTLTRIAYRLVPVSVYDTITLHDTLFAEMPYEHRHYSVPDTADVWYCGIDPRIDSLRLYNHVKVIEHTEVIREKAPRSVFSLSASTADARVGYSMRFGSFYAGVETGMTYDLKPVAGVRVGFAY